MRTPLGHQCRSLLSRNETPNLLTVLRLCLPLAVGLGAPGQPIRADEPLAVSMSEVAGDSQSGGPEYTFSIAVHEITNAEFVAFLNDALAHPADERGHYLYHAVDTGNVYLHSSETGDQGPDLGGILILDAAVNGRIVFVAGAYELDQAAFANHPVTGVSWLGAAKFCNWLTVQAGFSPTQRVYSEGPTPEDWHPVTISKADWQTRDLDAAEREGLLELVGYRLPMDDGATSTSVFNEWYKAAAWDTAASAYRTYGFGRNTITGADANYWASGDPFDGDTSQPRTTPVGFYGLDGDRDWDDPDFGWGYQPPDTFTVQDTDNSYGLYDASGNVWEWVQDQGSSPDRRATRGGSWQSAAASLVCTTRADRSAAAVSSTTGFRVVRSVAGTLLGMLRVTPDEGLTAVGPFGGEYDVSSIEYTLTNVGADPVDCRVDTGTESDLADFAEFYGCLTGPGVSPPGPECDPHDLDADGDVDLADLRRFQGTFGHGWLTVNGLAGPFEQTLSDGEGTTVTVAIDVACDSPVQLGLNSATINIANVTETLSLPQSVELTLSEPLTVAPPDDLNASGPVGGPFDPEDIDYTITSESASPIDWRVSTDQVWTSIDGVPGGTYPIAGTITPPETQAVVNIGFDESVNLLDAGVYTANVTLTDICTGQTFTRSVTLEVGAMVVTPEDDAAFTGIYGGPFEPDDFVYTIESLSQSALNWEVVADPEVTWLLINGGSSDAGTIPASQTADITIESSAEAESLPPGEYTTSLRFRNLTNQNNIYEVSRQVTLSVPELDVEPATDIVSSGDFAGPFSPSQELYTITNDGPAELHWRASYTTTPSGGTWLSLNGNESVEGFIFDQGGSAEVIVAIDEDAEELPQGVYSAEVKFEDLLTGASAIRRVELVVAFAFSVPTSVVEGDSISGGPDYDYRIGIYEISNSEFATFLNDALDNLDNERGRYMYHDFDSGDVYINSVGEVGTNGAGTRLFAAGRGGAISYDSQEGMYETASGLGNYPVVGVSWYGAVKFCNWMTLIQGMDSLDRAYHEGPNAADWYPVTVGTEQGSQQDTYAVRDLDAAERQELVDTVPGFRLPMDDGAAAASAYNECYKAHAWDPVGQTHATYGFGRDTLADPDANYLDSADPFENDDPPVTWIGFYNGFYLLADEETATADTQNAYGLYDACGNVAEWAQDQGDAPTQRATRGGSALDPAASVHLLADRRASDAAGATRSFTGFRIMQSLVLAGPPEVVPQGDVLITGVMGGPFSQAEVLYTLTNTLPVPTEWSAASDAGWVYVNGASATTGVLSEGESLIHAALNDGAYALLDSQESSVHTATITIGDNTTGTEYTRVIKLTLTQPITVAPAEGWQGAGPFRGPFAQVVEAYTVANDSDAAMDYQVTVDADWIDLDIDTNGTTPGELQSGEEVYVDVSLDASADDLLPGRHIGTVSFTNTTTGAVLTREVELVVTDAIEVTASGSHVYGLTDHAILHSCFTGPGCALSGVECGAFDFDNDSDLDLRDFGSFEVSLSRVDFRPVGLWGGPFASPVLQHTYYMANLLDIELDYSVQADVDWLTIDGDPASGTVDPQPAQLTFTATVNVNADTLDVGNYDGTITFTFSDAGVGGEVTRPVRLTVFDPLDIAPFDNARAFYNPPDAGTLDTETYTIHNGGEDLVGWEVSCDQPWLTIDGGTFASGALLPDESDYVTLGLNDTELELLTEGTYVAVVSFDNLLTGYTHTRKVRLTVDESLGVAPLTGLDAFGVVGENVAPSQQVYTLTNRTSAGLDWRVLRADPGDTWVLIDGAGSAAGTLDPSAETNVTVSIDQAVVAGLASGSYEADVSFVNDTAAVQVTVRPVTVNLTDPAPPVEVQTISSDDVQPSGPTYAFEIGTYEVTNNEFAAFLNDAYNNTGNERGYYMYHDIDSGDVYINTSEAGDIGTNGSGTLTVRMFSASANGSRITFDTDTYVVAAGYENHPVTGVSWYGALKYCNWLTIEQGLGPPQRCYHEGPGNDLNEWHPVTIAKAAWQTRDLNDTERQALVDDYRGYRLPMDDGSNNVDPYTDAADGYNEWYKASAWDQAGGVNHVFGFGRNTVVNADANYWESGDPFEGDMSAPRTTPVGFYNGDLYNPGGGGTVGDGSEFQTAANENYYGLHDASGNAIEWVQDRYSGLNSRALRGGSWANFQAQTIWIRTTDRSFASPSLTYNEIGFRVVRVAE